MDQKNSHNAIVIKVSIFLLISSFSSLNSTLVKFFNNISLFVIFFSIFPLIMALELLPNSPLGTKCHVGSHLVYIIYIPELDAIVFLLFTIQFPNSFYHNDGNLMSCHLICVSKVYFIYS